MILVRDEYERSMWTRRLREFREQLDAHPPTDAQRALMESESEHGRSFVIAVMDEEVAKKVLGILGREK